MTITSGVAGFATGRDIIESLVAPNMTRPVPFQANRRRVPGVVVPGYGWLLDLRLFAALVAAIYVLIRFMRYDLSEAPSRPRPAVQNYPNDRVGEGLPQGRGSTGRPRSGKLEARPRLTSKAKR